MITWLQRRDTVSIKAMCKHSDGEKLIILYFSARFTGYSAVSYPSPTDSTMAPAS
jgi:hypothetical protein